MASPYSRATRCTVEISLGHFCDVKRAPEMPFPICAEHALQLYRRMQDMVEDTTVRKLMTVQTADNILAHHRAKTNSEQHRVYYVRVGDLIKIGTTRKALSDRLAAYPPNAELLAVERGGTDVEAKRHHQFRHLLAMRKEWFHPAADLLDHIARLGRPAPDRQLT